MFGKGLYFASCPLKSANHSRLSPAGAPVDFWTGLWRIVTGDGLTSKAGSMLICDVHLGKCLTKRMSARHFNPQTDLKAGSFRNFFGFGDYDSVHAIGGFFGAVNVEEFIVYSPHQAIPKYLIEFEVVAQ